MNRVENIEANWEITLTVFKSCLLIKLFQVEKGFASQINVIQMICKTVVINSPMRDSRDDIKVYT